MLGSKFIRILKVGMFTSQVIRSLKIRFIPWQKDTILMVNPFCPFQESGSKNSRKIFMVGRGYGLNQVFTFYDIVIS